MKISEITTVITGGTPSTKNKAFWENGTIPWLQSGLCKNGYVNTCSKYITQSGLDHSSAKMMPAGTVIIALTGATVGKVGLMRIEACANQSVTGIIPCKSFLPLYVFYYLMSIRGKIIHDSYGDAQPHISQQYVKNIDIPLPKLQEQERIVARIEEMFSQLDAGVETLKKTKAQLDVYRQAVLKEAFEGKYTPDIIMCEKTMEEIADGKEGLRRGPFGSSIKKAFFIESGYKVYEQGNAINDDCKRGHYYISAEKYNELSSFQVRPGDFIVSCSGTIGKIAQLPADAEAGVINQALMRIRLKQDEIDPHYFILQFRSEVFQRKIISRGSGMGNLAGIKEFKMATMFVPKDYENQKLIVAEIESRMSVCDSIEKTVDTALQQAETMRQSILKNAFEGRL